MKIFNSERFAFLPELILFDLDNTLYHYDPAHEAAMDAVRGKVTKNFSVNAADFDNAFNSARSQIKDILKGTAASHNRLLYMQRMLEILGLGSQPLLSLDLEQTYWRTFLSNAVLFDEVKEFLDDLRLLNIQKIIVTDLTAQIQFRKLVFFGLENYFNYIVTSEEAGYDKPNPAPFKLALEKSKLNASKAWMIGDSLGSDIKGAQDIGAVTIQKIHNGVTAGSGVEAADASFHNFADIRKFIKNMVGQK